MIIYPDECVAVSFRWDSGIVDIDIDRLCWHHPFPVHSPPEEAEMKFVKKTNASVMEQVQLIKKKATQLRCAAGSNGMPIWGKFVKVLQMRYLLETLSYCKKPPWRLVNYQKNGQNHYFFGDLRNLSSLKYQIMTHDPPEAVERSSAKPKPLISGWGHNQPPCITVANRDRYWYQEKGNSPNLPWRRAS